MLRLRRWWSVSKKMTSQASLHAMRVQVMDAEGKISYFYKDA